MVILVELRPNSDNNKEKCFLNLVSDSGAQLGQHFI